MRIKGWIGYTVYGIAVTIVFLFLLFPAGLLKNILESSAARYGTVSLAVDSAGLVLPPAIRLKNCRLAVEGKGDASLVIDFMEITPVVSELLRGRAAFDAEGKAYGGDIAARITMEDRFSLAGPVNITGDLRNVDIGRCAWFQKAAGRKIEGALKGTGDFTGDPGNPIDGTGNFDAVLFNGNLELLENILGFDTVAFDRIEMKGDLKTRTVKVHSINMIGKEMNAELNGSIYLDGTAEKTRIALKGFLSVPALNKKIPLSVGGTAAGPAVHMRKI